MQPPLQRLTLVAPRALENELVAILLGMHPPLPGFTVLPVAGHGQGFERASTAERVRGSIDRVLLWLVLPVETLDRLLARLSAELPSSDVVWWVEPVERGGRLA
ncbi:DUF3240 family protein [Dyella sedimenti]|uniref:DUF3240 family protein n=1 Tax=Dyella sedimenti TaxID=2919947 RepID=UPI001FAA8B93|nr:DUF3240 family protein [Dyella sedimenti]